MKKRNSFTTDQFFNFAKDSYLERTSRPLYAIIFLAPFILFYEMGTVLINTNTLNQSQIRVVAFLWLQNFLEYIGFASKFAWTAPPLAVIIILLSLQLASKKKWNFWAADFIPMTIECILLAVPLIVFSLFLNTSSPQPANPQSLNQNYTHTAATVVVCAAETDQNQTENSYTEKTASQNSVTANLITAIGAGIYEELIFRLILISLLMLFFQDILRMNPKTSVILAVLISAAMFGAYHYITFLNGTFGQIAAFNWTEFWFRTAAGIYLAILFAMRGFAITAGTHAFYDIIAVLLNCYFFQH